MTYSNYDLINLN